MRFRSWLALLAFSTCLSAAAQESDAPDGPDFNLDVRPILSDHCFACHGPDEKQRLADLRLDTAEGITSMIEPGDIDASELIRRIESDDDDEVMPPPKFRKPLSAKQKEVLHLWVASGAAIAQHWSFVPPARPAMPGNKKLSGRSAIDYFIATRARAAGLQLNRIADRRTLLRRVCLDLTGLPPTREQIEAFVADESPDAYEKLVDRLLESPHFGQHVGRHWLDLVRYADTHGLHLDNYREMWPYRDWVIDALNRNMPFDQFITHQLAGDLLPHAGNAEQIASGFNRLNVTTNEGGSIYDEVFTRNVIDRTDAFGTIFLGMTAGCAVCHDHKFDPLTSRDYYSLSAFFNSLDGRAMDGNVKDHAPVISVATDEQLEKENEYNATLAEIRREMQGPIESVDSAQRAWEESLVEGRPANTWTLKPAEVTSQAGIEMKVHDDGSAETIGTAAAKDTTTITAPLPTGGHWQTLHLEVLTGGPDERAGVSSNGNAVLTEIVVETTDSLSGGQWMKMPIAHAFADIEQQDGPFAVAYAIDSKVNDNEGWAIAGHQQTGPRNAWFVIPSLVPDGEDAKIRVQLKYQSKFAQHQFRRVRLSLSDAPPSVPEAQRVALGAVHSIGPFPVESSNPGYSRKFASQQGPFQADEVFKHEDRPYRWHHRADLPQVEVNELATVKDRASVMLLHQGITAPAAVKITLLLGSDDGHVVYLNGNQVGMLKGARKINPLAREYELALQQGHNDLYIKVVNHGGESKLAYAYRSPAIEVPAKLVSLLGVPESKRTPETIAALRKYYRKVYCLHPDWLALIDQQRGIERARQELKGKISTTLVWKELPEPRQAHVLTRGQYDQPGDAVPRATPEFLPAFPGDAPRDRLGLATWLTSADHPLTARVAVNRFWQQVFGTGLVKTSEDFGSQGEPPSHPQLLDWLAVEFRESGWNVKRLIKMLVMTDAYQRSAEVTETMQAMDPDNRLLARGPRHRLDGEVLRDQALALSGLLVDRPGGPSVKPPQPEGLWAAVGYSGSNTVRFKADEGDKVYRRSVYTFWKRTSPPPQMTTFDAPSRESCTARRERTNTPLQALLLMNETQYIEAARHLSQRAIDATDVDTDQQRVAWLFETVTARMPSEHEHEEMISLLDDVAAYYNESPELAAKLGESSDPRRAAWTVLASTLLNLDEVITK